MQHTEKTKYSVNILLYRCHNDIDTKSEEEMKKILETYKRKKIKVFFKYIYNKSSNKIEKAMFTQMSRPAHIIIKMSKIDYETYHEKYTYNVFVLKDRCRQMVLDNHGNLSKPQQKLAF